jgi:hypothetical protein
MTRTLKALGLALLAVCAFGAVAASSASATTTDKFTCIKNGVNIANCDITGTGSATFGAKVAGVALSVTCSHETYSGTATNNATEVTVKPTYEGCTALGGPAPIDTNGCAYVLKGTTTSHNKTTTGTETDAGATLECPNPDVGIKITAPGCTIEVETTHTNPTVEVNHLLHGAIYDDEGSGNTTDVKVTVTVDQIAYTAHGIGCAAAFLPTTGTDGFLTGTATAKGYVDNSKHEEKDHVGIKVDTP